VRVPAARVSVCNKAFHKVALVASLASWLVLPDLFRECGYKLSFQRLATLQLKTFINLIPSQKSNPGARASAENFPGGPTEKRPKIGKKYRKIVLFSLFQGSQRKKDWTIAKKGRKIALLSLYLLYLCYVWKSMGGPRPPLPTPMPWGAYSNLFFYFKTKESKNNKLCSR